MWYTILARVCRHSTPNRKWVHMNIERTKEFLKGLLDRPAIAKLFADDAGVSYVHHAKNPVLIGSHFLLKVNTSVGIDRPDTLDEELKKIEAITSCCFHPDLIMDHTRNIELEKPIWRYLTEMTDVPIGTVPVYSVYDNEKGIEKSALLEKIEEMAIGGVNFMTFHPTATRELHRLSKASRPLAMAMSSWGGGVVLSDAEINKRDSNIIEETFLDILKILKKHNVTLSVGAVYRPARIDDALDEIHLLETVAQGRFIDIAKTYGVNVIMEGIGHITLSGILKYSELVKPFNTPLMPLGPMPTDSSIKWDHVTGAVGATFAAFFGNVGIINGVTREEHTGGVPSTQSVIEGLMCAVDVAHMINLERFEIIRNLDRAVSDYRAKIRSCRANGGLYDVSPNPENSSGCDRCGIQCPLKFMS